MVDRCAPVRSVWLTVQLFLQPQTHSRPEGQRSEVPVRTNPALRAGMQSRGNASANAFLAALLRLWSVEMGAELYMVIRSRRRAPAAPASCMFRFSPTPKIVAKIVAGKKEKKNKKTQLCATNSVFFPQEGKRIWTPARREKKSPL